MPEFRTHLLKHCLINPPPEPGRERAGTKGLAAALAGLFVPRLIEAAITGVAGALKKAGAEETVQLAADEFCDLYVADDRQALQPNPELGGVLGVWFEEPGTKAPPEDEVARTLKETGLVPARAAVGGVFEAAIRPVPDGTAFFLETRHFSVRDFIGDRRRDERDYVVTLGLAAPGAKAEGSTFALGRIDLGRLRRGGSVVPPGHPQDGFPRYRSNLMPWSKISQASKAAYDRDVAANRAANQRYMPVTLSLTVTETADGHQFLLALGELLGGLAEKAAGEIGTAVLPAELEQAAAERAASAEALYEEELTAELDLRKAQQAYDAGKEADKPALRVALEMARRKLDWQARLRTAAGLPARPPVDPA